MASSEKASVRLSCPRCGARLRAPSEHLGQSLSCPQCHGPVVVAHERSGLASDSSTPPPEADLYALRDMTYAVAGLPPEQHSGPVVPASLPADSAVAPLDETSEEDPLGKDEARPLSQRPKLPQWPLFTGVLAFFWQTTAIVLWVVFSVFGALILVMGILALAGLTTTLVGLGAAFPWIVGMLLAAATCITGLAWMVAASAVWLAILQDSAAGNDKVETWPTMVFVDWMGGFFYLFVSLFLSGGAGYMAARLLDASAPAMAVSMGASLLVLFPIALLSTLETQSPLVPFSAAVLGSLLRSWKGWLVFYLQTALLGVVVLGAARLFAFAAGEIRSEGLLLQFLLLAASAMALLTVGAQMLYFRLLGRLAWICVEQSREADEQAEADEARDAEGNDPEIHPTPVDDF